MELSVRSGGHSYSCTSSRVRPPVTSASVTEPPQARGLQLDMRGLATVELLPSNLSSTGWAARLGPGATWAQVGRRAANEPLRRFVSSSS